MARRPRPRARAVDPFDPLDGPVGETLDLHGLTADQARAKVRAALERIRKAKPGTLVHVITGKGNHSVGQPVLRGAIRALLRSGSLPQVARWGVDDDEGGFLVRLK